LEPSPSQESFADVGLSLLADDEIKSEPEEEECFADFYPELTLSEVNVGLPTLTPQLPAKHDMGFENESADLELPSNPYISNVLLGSLIRHLTASMTATEVYRSVTCFVPVIRIQNQDLPPLISKTSRKKTQHRKSRRVTKTIPQKNLKTNLPPKSYKPKVVKTERDVKVRTVRKRSQASPVTTKPEGQKAVKDRALKTLPKVSKKKETLAVVIKAEKSRTCHEGKRKIPGSGARRSALPKVSSKKNQLVETDAAIPKEVKTHSCGECMKEFRTEIALLHHQKPLENGEGESTCRLCNLELKNPNCLRYHYELLHDKLESDSPKQLKKVKDGEESSPSRVCEICNKTFTRISGLLLHRRTARTNNNPYMHPHSIEPECSLIEYNSL